jgi:hypothetical protein
VCRAKDTGPDLVWLLNHTQLNAARSNFDGYTWLGRNCP